MHGRNFSIFMIMKNLALQNLELYGTYIKSQRDIVPILSGRLVKKLQGSWGHFAYKVNPGSIFGQSKLSCIIMRERYGVIRDIVE